MKSEKKEKVIGISVRSMMENLNYRSLVIRSLLITYARKRRYDSWDVHKYKYDIFGTALAILLWAASNNFLLEIKPLFFGFKSTPIFVFFFFLHLATIRMVAMLKLNRNRVIGRQLMASSSALCAKFIYSNILANHDRSMPFICYFSIHSRVGSLPILSNEVWLFVRLENVFWVSI